MTRRERIGTAIPLTMLNDAKSRFKNWRWVGNKIFTKPASTKRLLEWIAKWKPTEEVGL